MRSGIVPEWSMLSSRQRHALVDPGQLERVLDAHRGEQSPRRRIPRPAARHRRDGAEWRGQAAERGARDRLDLVGRGRRAERRVHHAGLGRAARLSSAAPLAVRQMRAARCACTPAGMRSGGRVVEGARLESEYTAKAYRGFESLPLRHPVPATHPKRADARQSASISVGNGAESQAVEEPLRFVLETVCRRNV